MQKANLRGTNIDYYCFPNNTLKSAFTDLKDIGIREKARQESTRSEIEKAREIGKLLLFDLESKKFSNENGTEIDITGKVIFPRSSGEEQYVLIEHIEKADGISIVKKEEIKSLWKWFEKIPTERTYKITTIGKVEERFRYFKREYGSFLFVKTLENEKFSGMVILLKLFEDRQTLVDSNYHSIHRRIKDSETPIIVYQWIEPLKDDYGKRLWRAFVVNGELISLSRCANKNTHIEDYVHEEVRKRIESFKDVMPLSYVADFFEYQDDKSIIFDVSEFYSIVSSRTFANNEIIY